MKNVEIDFSVTTDADGYHFADFFVGGMETIWKAEAAANYAEADAILRAAYIGPDNDRIECDWREAMGYRSQKDAVVIELDNSDQ